MQLKLNIYFSPATDLLGCLWNHSFVKTLQDKLILEPYFVVFRICEKVLKTVCTNAY